MSELVPEPWEIWHARFDFDDGKGYKYRPVIVLGTRDDGSLVMMVTSATNKLRLEHDYLIRDWRQAGLDKPSIARVDRIAQIPPRYLGSAGKLGRLTNQDISALSAILASL
ncbi:type II toxin-antitoxin system PemK/MazF family toxin [uncultured Parolsenella sp.]|uniref:type II toxin-antitoxin system PemK/MazF family toxin n=1 Tax=uncultured Parolsenella sp. TaxID=2083008 RepID=UPI0027D9A6A2|nr:type II toxin-antitoxin system PemK/MazF family toxin [uncultured Parolsenella sp.]